MDFLKLVSNEMLLEYTNNLNYDLGFLGAQLFPQKKYDDPVLRVRRLADGGNIPVMAQVHAYDTEAKIGERPSFVDLKVEPLLIKEKLPLSERARHMLGKNASNSEVINFVFDDAANLVRRCITRTEVENMELLATGKVTIDENNVKTTIDYNVPVANSIAINGWNTEAHDIIADIEKVQEAAAAKGYSVVRAVTSSKMIGYMLKNTAVKGYWANKAEPLTKPRLLTWLGENFGIEFVINDAQYKTALGDATAKHFFDPNTISWLTTDTALGEGVFGVTPEQEAQLKTATVEEQSLVTLTRWEEVDPVITWVKGSCVYVPALANADGLFISKHTEG